MIGFDEVLYEDAIKSVYREFIRKLCNIRVEEFLSTTRKKFANERGNASTKEQNLRDTLLTHHISLQSKIK